MVGTCCCQQSKCWDGRALSPCDRQLPFRTPAARTHCARCFSTERVLGRLCWPAVESWLFSLNAFHFRWNTFLPCSSGFADMDLTCAGGSCKLVWKSAEALGGGKRAWSAQRQVMWTPIPLRKDIGPFWTAVSSVVNPGVGLLGVLDCQVPRC